ncbi:TlpA disulfide reductase family protein [Flavobacterium sp. ACN6]|uniref:TlpA disulfide reductase family protein n=1 Tax=Flavobacterium sp. ACN6 TaxID=1920426 RepID=UPI000BB3351B|nr:TlpA disulfide reductase family protein [Flavobacterium sp. ACN6]PBJ11857.1 Thiol-disulfide oxidoreductase ResA [Flavobacterium sp. ACN6]
MKKFTILLFFTVVSTLFSQNGKIYLKDSKFKIGAANTYVYEPPKGLVIEENSKANVLYVTDEDFSADLNTLKKSGKFYEFTTKVPDSARLIMVTITDLQKVADNNNDQGYSVLLRTQNETELGKTLVNEIFVRGYSNYFLGLKIDVKPENQVAKYEAVYAKYPKLKDDKVSVDYLYNKKALNKEQGDKDLLAFAAKCLEKNTEEYLNLAYSIYQGSNMPEEAEKLGKEISTRFPEGKNERMNFIRKFYEQPDKTEASILESINTFKTKFKNAPKGSLNYFYQNLLTVYLDKGEFKKAIALEPHLKNASDTYNNFAWGQSGGDLTTPVKNIDFVTKISQRSVYLLEEKSKQSFSNQYRDQFNMYADTYALLLYKQGKYQEAFKYQNAVKEKNGLDAGGKDRYLAMLSKVKSTDEVQVYVEDEIKNKGVTSPVFLSKLKEIYIEKKLPIAEYDAIKQKSDLLAKENKNKALLEKFGSTNASDFTLKNMEGKETKLSDYKGKLVVLDFWATWCGPCKASFPKMQNLVTKYKGKDVEFLFVNTWENGKEDEIFKKVTTYITDKKFDFNVVFDSKAEVVANYKIEAIPTRILIGKDGSILFSDNSNTNLGDLIDEQLK